MAVAHSSGAAGVDPDVAWSESRLAGARWLHLVGERRAVFRQLGRLASDDVHAVQDALPERNALRRWATSRRGSAVYLALRRLAEQDYPEVVVELESMADGAGIDPEELLLANLRGDIGVPDGTGCTDVARRGSRSFIAHNEDGATALEGRLIFVTLAIEGEPTVTTQWYPGFVPGNAHVVTSAGLAWGVNHIQVREPAMAAGRHFLARRMQGAASLDQAVSWLRSTPTAGGFAYTLGEFGTGRIAVVETAAGESFVLELAEGAFAWHTNHLRWLPAELDSTNEPSRVVESLGLRSESESRGDVLSSLKCPARPESDWFLGVLASGPSANGVRRSAVGDDPLTTLMTTVVDLDRRLVTLRAADGEPVAISADDLLRRDERQGMQRKLRGIGSAQ